MPKLIPPGSSGNVLVSVPVPQPVAPTQPQTAAPPQPKQVPSPFRRVNSKASLILPYPQDKEGDLREDARKIIRKQ